MNSSNPWRSRLSSVGLVVLLMVLLFGTPTVRAVNEESNPTIAGEAASSVTQSSDPHYLSKVGNRLLFAATDGVNGYGLWATEEAATSVVHIKAIIPRSTIVVSSGIGFFAADDGEHGVELWRTDGTSAGTQLVADLNPGLAGSNPTAFTDVNGALFFTAAQGNTVNQLWQSDGTAAGTKVVTDRVSPYYVTQVNHKLYLVASSGQATIQLWVSDGTDAGTIMLREFGHGTALTTSSTAHPPIVPPYDPLLTAVNDTLFFRADDDLHGIELWKSDGTPEGTVLVKDLNPGPLSSAPWSFTSFQGTLFFSTNEGFAKSDGTAAGTHLIKPALFISQFQPVGDLLLMVGYESVHGLELWRSDGTTDGTLLVKDINLVGESYIRRLTALYDKAILLADDGVHGPQLWHSDGTADGTTIIKDVTPTLDSSGAVLFTVAGNQLFFPAYDRQYGVELWRSDGTAAGTTVVADINQQPELRNSSLQLSTLVHTGSDGIANIQIDYMNRDWNPQRQITLTAVLSESLTYHGSNGVVQPTVQGNVLVWQLPDLAPWAADTINLYVQAPVAPLGTRYAVALTLATVTGDGAPVQSSRNVEIRIAAHYYLPIITR